MLATGDLEEHAKLGADKGASMARDEIAVPVFQEDLFPQFDTWRDSAVGRKAGLTARTPLLCCREDSHCGS